VLSPTIQFKFEWLRCFWLKEGLRHVWHSNDYEVGYRMNKLCDWPQVSESGTVMVGFRQAS
jgi:hypothetical protein